LNLFYKIKKRIKWFILILLNFSVYNPDIFAQLVKKPVYIIETGATVSFGKETPFWFISNQYGLISPNRFNSWVKAGIHTSIDSSKNIDFNYGFDLINRYANTNSLYLHQGYARLKLWFMNIQAGKIEEKFGNQDPELSSGGLLWSGNARPMTKITINVPNYTPIPLTKGYLEFKGGISHGWFDDNEYIKNVWLHHKYIYLQAGGKLPVHIHYGFHHYAQWGGISSDTSIGKLPSGFSDFIKVFFGQGGEGSTSAPWEETTNRIGNHIGSRNFGFDLELKNYKIAAYWQTIFEDGSGRAYRNIADGLWGLSITSTNKNKIITELLYEYINTTDQSGTSDLPVSGSGKGGGNDNYFNHGFYVKGWTYNEMTIGTPFITSPIIQKGMAQSYLSRYIINNKVQGYHIGIKGTYKQLKYVILYSYIRNYGTNMDPLNSKQNSVLLKTKITNILPYGIDAGFSIAGDYSKLYGNNIGFQISLLKTNFL
jgi:hypothetical protein